MKETAIQWLLEELNNGRHLNDELIEKAKEMEKQQIETAYNKAALFKYGKEYYEETFNK
jgi:hypothetical protein